LRHNNRKTLNQKPGAMNHEQRYNIFKRTHKGLRSMLFDAGAKIQQTDFTKHKQAKVTLEAIKQTTRSFLYHLNKEDNVIYHTVVLYAPYIIALIEQKSANDAELAKSIEKIIAQYELHKGKKEMLSFGIQLQSAYFEFTAAVLQHMNKEALVINELLWSNYTDTQLVGMEVEMMKQACPDDCGWYTSNILSGLTNAEIIFWVDRVSEHGTLHMKEKLISTVRSILPIDRWQMIRGKFSARNIAA